MSTKYRHYDFLILIFNLEDINMKCNEHKKKAGSQAGSQANSQAGSQAGSQAKYRTFALLFLLIFLSACATSKPTIPLTPPLRSEAQSLWDKFLVAENTLQPYTLSGSLRFGYVNETHRVNYILWSNGELPLRLDIQAGIGASIAKIEETEKTLLIYFPQEKRAILVDGGSQVSALLTLGMPMPLSFLDLSHLLRGNLPHAFQGIKLKSIDLEEGASVEEKYIFHFENKELFGSMRLNSFALPVNCDINDEWQISIDYNQDNKPYKVKLSSLFDGYKAILLVKDRKDAHTYPSELLKLTLPQNTPITVN